MDVPYGPDKIRLQFPSTAGVSVDFLRSKATAPAVEKVGVAVLEALQTPIGTPPLEQMVSPDETVCIVTSDISRPMPTASILPPLVNYLTQYLGLKCSNIHVVFALGIHRRHNPSEHERLLGRELTSAVSYQDSDPDTVVFVGRTPLGTPVEVTRSILEFDRIICLGNVEYHYFAGYTGGAKAILPGVCSHETISCNHRRMLEKGVGPGQLQGNPVREDIDAVLDLIQVDFIVNVVLNRDGGIAQVVAGHPLTAHRVATKRVDQMNRISIDRRYDAVVASAGGFPKDIDLYQAQKALHHAAEFARPGAPILLIARCSEGFGNEVMAKWFEAAESPSALMKRLLDGFELGGHKAAMIAQIVEQNPIWLCSDMAAENVRSAFLQPVDPPENGTLFVPPSFIKTARANLSSRDQLRIALLSEAGSALPVYNAYK